MEPHSDDVNASPNSSRSRAEQKKHMARVAQQRHRQRQKDRIAELEAQLSVLKESGCGQMRRLVDENTRLRQELRHRDSLLDEFAEVLSRRRATVLPSTWAEPPLPLSDNEPTRSLAEEAVTWDPTRDALSLWKTPLTRTLCDLPSHSASKVLLPPPPYDHQLHHIITMAREQRLGIAPPTVEDFLLEDSPNLLSRELKLYKHHWRSRRCSADFLAAYWILYLLVRWQATLDPEAFEAMPAWMRPTILQREAEHLNAIDQVVWPDLRDEIISLSLLDVEAACGVLLDIGKHMVIDVETTEASTIESIQRVVAQLSDMARWKLAPVFFEKYPQWAWTSAC
ncbi:hypothetical protein B0T11DRAFT_15686 [Plectosphaerella cucumerina]|uniref:BZIP domain-containing protein n=1 Tax=Plectosphaerella cucumerina TaxID=40658 RepID=A0A8K0X8J8_9PEZI|nr:hypothetical protein B0T11DRAFT_15686 [Plectosphaerella cucumerina]